MELNLSRTKSDANSTIGELMVDWEPFCQTVEDAWRPKKIPKITRIPAGVYQVKFRFISDKELKLWPENLTNRYRDRFDWFTYHLELQGVPGFQFVYIHVGNWSTDSDGCILVGNYSGGAELKVSNSVATFKALYLKCKNALENGEAITITILDEPDELNHNKRLALAA